MCLYQNKYLFNRPKIWKYTKFWMQIKVIKRWLNMKWEKKEEEGEKKRWKCGWIIINLGGVSDAEWREYSGPHYSPGATREEGNGKESINHSFDSSFIPSFLFLLSSFLIIARFLLFFLSFYTLIFVFHTFFCLGLLSSSTQSNQPTNKQHKSLTNFDPFFFFLFLFLPLMSM